MTLSNVLRTSAICASLLSLTYTGLLAKEEPRPEKPRLIVGIVVDQMRYDYLSRFDSVLGDNGFKRIINSGTQYSSMHYNYVPTATGPGHSAVWTGAYPANSGIAANKFFDRELGRRVNCIEDKDQQTVGSTSDAGEASPKRLMVTTIGDELRLHSNLRSLVYSISIKDRASILPGGHLSNGSFWFDDDTGNFVTSTFFMDQLPDWVSDYNQQQRPAQLLATPWTLRDAPATYSASRSDDNAYELPFPGESAPVFPHDLNKATQLILPEGGDPYELLRISPWGNTIVREMAEATLRNTDLGQDEFTDILAISFSSTDYVGHRFGPASKEVEDTYRRLDDELASLLKTIDETVGLENTLIFLTADHGAAYNVHYINDLGLHMSENIDLKSFQADIQATLEDTYGAGDWILNIGKGQIYLDRELIKARGLKLVDVQNTVKEFLIPLPMVSNAYTATELLSIGKGDGFGIMMQHGCHPTRSGDVFIKVESGCVVNYPTGATHGECYSYDTHVPFIISGPGIPSGQTLDQRVVITQLAPTLSSILRISKPSGSFEGPLPLDD